MNQSIWALRFSSLIIYVLVMLFSPINGFSASRQNRVIRVKKARTLSVKADSSEHHLYFPLLKNGADYVSNIGLVNVDSQTVNFTLHVMDQDGTEVLTPVQGSLEPMGRYYGPISDNQIDGQLWGEVISDGSLSGYLNLVGRGGVRSMFVRGSETMEKQLYLPHIAPEVQYWNTYTAIVNGNRLDTEFSNVFLDYVAGTKPLTGPIKPLSQYWCEWAEDVFPSGFPDEMPFWGKIRNNVSAEKTDDILTGMELFVRKGNDSDGNPIHQECGLDLASKTAGTLFFPHIDVGGGYWWTGIAIENISTGTATVTFQPYDGAGTALTPVSYDMTASQKLVKVVQGFWTDKDLTYPSDTAWIQVSTEEGRLIGYELFGTLDAKKSRLLAGINAPSDGSKMLLYPHVDSSAAFWTGIAAVNIGTQAGTLTAIAYDNSGNKLKTITISDNLAPDQKVVNTVKVFFTDNENDGPPAGTTMVTLQCDQPIVGFELWGNLSPEQDYISGMLATPLPEPTFREGFEKDDFSAAGSTWELWPLSDNQDQGLGWDLASLTSYGTGGTFHSVYAQSVPNGFDYIVGYFGDENVRNHQILVSPLIALPANVTELSFYSQFGWPDYALDSDAVYVTSDTTIGEGWSLDRGTALKTFTKTYIKGLPLSNEPALNGQDLSFTRWKREKIDISAYAGEKVRFIFEINSAYGESWQVDDFEVK